MIKAVNNLGKVKKAIETCLNSDVNVKVNLGRNKFVCYRGRVTNVYPALFTVSPYGEFRGKTSFSYSEVMCGSVVIRRDHPN
ncbi:MAG: Veg family protein [Candidatus Borkfalkiaceae bacterium]|nr:Veg family protein [Christensenellaceae bacterium]